MLLPGEDGEVGEHAAGLRNQTTDPADDGRQSRIQRAHHENRPGRDRTIGVVYDRTNGSAATCAPSAEATSARPFLLWDDLAAFAEVERVRYRCGVRFGGARREVGGQHPTATHDTFELRQGEMGDAGFGESRRVDQPAFQLCRDPGGQFLYQSAPESERVAW